MVIEFKINPKEITDFKKFEMIILKIYNYSMFIYLKEHCVYHGKLLPDTL